MIYTKKDNFGNEIHYLRINKEDLSTKYNLIKNGTRGKIFNYQNEFAFKVFMEQKRKLLKDREQLIKSLMQVKDESFCFPIGFLEYFNHEIEGYYMEYLNENYITLEISSKIEKKLSERIQCILKIDEAIKRIHKKGIIIGDLNNRNIMVDKKGNPKFVDTDSFGYDKFLPEENLACIRIFQEEFGTERSFINCDKYWLGVLTLEYLCPKYLFPKIEIPNYPEELREFVKKCRIPKEVKEGFYMIFSDAVDKPYVGQLLEKINPEQELIKTRKRKIV